MSHENDNSRYTQKQIDSFTEARVRHDAELLRKGAHYRMGHFVITGAQYRNAHREMDLTFTGAGLDQPLTIEEAEGLEPRQLDQLTNRALWSLLEQYPEVTEALRISPQDFATRYLEFVLSGDIVEANGKHEHAITMDLNGSYVGISNEKVSGLRSPSSGETLIALVDVRLGMSRETERFTGEGLDAEQYGSRETTIEEHVYIVNALRLLGIDDGKTKSIATDELKAMYRK